jgi:O-antigen/teichoic acid export membrane protein
MLSEATVVGVGITRKSIYAMLASIIAFIVNAVLNYLLIPSYGASGAALATMIAFFVFFIIRTEASSYLWKSLPRAKIYLLSVAYIITTIVMVLTEASQKFYFIIWILLFTTTLLLFFRRSKESFLYLKGRV